MKKLTRFLLLLLILCLVVSCIVSCQCKHTFVDGKCSKCGADDPDYKPDTFEEVDYVSQVKLDRNSSTAKLEVTVYAYIDGDTTHFNVPTTLVEDGVLKARYLAVDTPESTGRIEEFGKKASNFTKEKLSNSDKIIIESGSDKWSKDSTGTRYLAWIWYLPKGETEYRNLNLELLQNGLARANSASNSLYGDACMKAAFQAQKLKLNLYSGERDPDFYYGEALEITLKELRVNLDKYPLTTKVIFEGTVVTNSGSNGVYVQDYDEETKSYYGIYVYYGTSGNSNVISALSRGNRVHVVGLVSEFQGAPQISSLIYKSREPNSLDSTHAISKENDVEYTEVSASDLTSGKVTLDIINAENETVEQKEYDFAELRMSTAVTLKDIVVTGSYTSDDGAITIYGKVGDISVQVRTLPFKDSQGNLITQDYYKDKTITAKGVVDVFNDKYQVKVFQLSNIIVQD